MLRKKVDISELYDALRNKLNTYVLCFDIEGLMAINEISHGAGDMAILESLKRVDEIASEDMILFRIGGDEFALVTGLMDVKEVESLARKVLSLNGNAINYKGQDISVSMRASGTKFKDKNIRYSDLFTNLQNILNITRDNLMDFLIVE